VTKVQPTLDVDWIQGTRLARNLRANVRHALSDELYGANQSHTPPTATANTPALPLEPSSPPPRERRDMIRNSNVDD
jgi:hypothetical protein